METFLSNGIRNLWPGQSSSEPTVPSDQTPAEEEPTIELLQTEKMTRLGSPEMIDPRPLTPDNQKPKSNLDLIKECDSFPYHQTDPKLYFQHVRSYYHFGVAAYPDTTLGYVLPSVAEVLRGLPDWTLNDKEGTLTLSGGSNEEERSAIVAATAAAMRTTGHFTILKGWRNELYPVYGPNQDLLFSIERAASALFGVVTYGCHMTAYTLTPRTALPSEDVPEKSAKDSTEAEAETEATTEQSTSGSPETDEKELKIWVPRRARSKQTYGGMLDNTVAGGLSTHENPFDGLVREASEEASLPSSLVRSRTKAVGSVTYFHIRDERAGGETKLLQPEVQYVYDLELPVDVVPKPSDDEVEEFYLMGIEEVKEAMRKGEFKPNCAVVLLDFFVRHGLLTMEGESDYLEIVSRLHRKLEFPTR